MQVNSGGRFRGHALAVGGVGAVVGGFATAVALAAASKPIVVSDVAEPSAGPLDLKRISLRRAPDGRLRAGLTFAAGVTPKSLLAGSGPPGSACVRIWTDAEDDPLATRPDRLVCVTARSEDELRGSVYQVRGAALPRRVANASVARNRNGRSFVVRFTQSSLGRPQRIRFTIEATRPGCDRPSCVDTVPDAGAVRTFRLR